MTYKSKFPYIVLLLIGFSLCGVSCGSGEEDEPITPNPPSSGHDQPKPPTPPSYPTFNSPNWYISDISSFEQTMTVVVSLPDSLANGELTTDKMAVFAGDDCRGVADRIEVSPGINLWMAMVYGNNASEPLSFKYYSSKTKHMYQSASTLPFTTDGTIGTVDSPQSIGMCIVTEIAD